MRKLKPVTPGELLLEEFLKPMGISQYRLAKEIGVPAQRIGEIVAGGATGRKTQLVQGTPEELAKVLVDFLKDRGFV